jgi:hypothetical protein
MIYTAQTALRPSRLSGISELQIEQHWKLYQGYLAHVNLLLERLRVLRQEEKGKALLFADRRRRLGFEYNGMVLHEYYFGNLQAHVAEPSDTNPLKKALVAHYGSFATFKEHFANPWARSARALACTAKKRCSCWRTMLRSSNNSATSPNAMRAGLCALSFLCARRGSSFSSIRLIKASFLLSSSWTAPDRRWSIPKIPLCILSLHVFAVL